MTTTNNESFLRLLPVFATAVLTIFFGTTSYYVANQDERIAKNVEKVEEIRDGQQGLRERLQAIETDTGYIKRDMGEVKESVREIERLIIDALADQARRDP